MKKRKQNVLKNGAYAALISTSIACIILASTILNYRFNYVRTDICSDLPNKLEYISRCIENESIIVFIGLLVFRGILPISMSFLFTFGVLTHNKINSEENKKYKNIAIISILLNIIYLIVVICAIVIAL